MKVLSLFSGIGLHDLGLTLAGMKIAGQCEIDPFALAVLAKYWPDVYRWKDVRDVTRESILEHCGHIDLITGGFPCQNLSIAGKGAGIGTEENPTEKSGLVWELLRIIRAVRPHWLILENVPRLRTLGADTILGEMEEIGYSCWPLVVGAEHFGAPHRRHRVWIVGKLAYTDCGGSEKDSIPSKLWSSRTEQPSSDSRIPDSWQAGEVRQREMADAAICGFVEGSRLWGYGESRGGREPSRSHQGTAMALAGGEGLAKRREMSIGSGPKEPVFASSGDYLWPSRPGQEQFEWEESRLALVGVGRPATRSLRRLVRSTEVDALETLSLSPAQNEALEKWANEEALRCYGNANPPHAIELIGKAILNISKSGNAV